MGTFFRIKCIFVTSVMTIVLVINTAGTTDSKSLTNETLHYRYICPQRFENVGRKCYHFSKSSVTWFQAYFACNDLTKSNLTIINDRYDLKQLEDYLFKNRNISGSNDSNNFWVGGFKDWKQKKWIYTDGSLIQFPSNKDIHMSEKDNWTCLLIDGRQKRWNSENCMERRPYICDAKAISSIRVKLTDKMNKKISIDQCIDNPEVLTKKQKRKCSKLLQGTEKKRNLNGYNKPAAVIQKTKPAYSPHPAVIRTISHICPQDWTSLGNQCYLFSKEKVTWSEAHFNCNQINSKLAMIRSKKQDQKLRIFLNGFMERQERWIGGRYNIKTNEWIWALNGKPLKYKGFFTTPLLATNNSLHWQAIVMDPQHGYKWNHRNELEKHFYICQVKGRSVKRLNYSRRQSATIQIIPNRRYQRNNDEYKSYRHWEW